MFDRGDLVRRLQGFFDKFTVEQIFFSLSDPELDVADNDSYLGLRDFPLLAIMKELTDEEKGRLASKLIPSEYLSDFVKFNANWMDRHHYLSGCNGVNHGCPRQEEITSEIREQNRCRIFYSLRLESNSHHPVNVAA